MKNVLGVCAVAFGLLVPISLAAQDQRSDDNRRLSQGYGDSHDRWQGRLSAEDQGRFDSYYSRWVESRQNNNRDQQNSMEDRMREVMSRYNIPSDVGFDQIASNRDPGYQVDRRHDRDDGRNRDADRGAQWQNRLSGKDQRRFDSYYSRWLDAGRANDRHQAGNMERRMRDLMGRYSIPSDARFSQVASVSARDRDDRN